MSAAARVTAPTATLLISCPDQRGLVARTAQFRDGLLLSNEKFELRNEIDD